MKKKAAAITALGVVAVVILAAAAFLQSGKSYFPPRPEDTTLEFWICDDGTLVDWKEYVEIGGCMGGREFLGKGYHVSALGERPCERVSYILTAWPDYADGGSYVTKIEITDPMVSVYGLTVESEPAEFEQVMTSMGYKVEWVDGNFQRAVRDGFTVSIYRGNTPLLQISAEIGNREGIVF